MKNYFNFFNLPKCFNIDMDLLDETYYNFQKKIHPDNFIQKSKIDQETSIKLSTYLNKAYSTLRDPFLRSIYLCKLNGIDLNTQLNPNFPNDFLEQQIKWRETLNIIKNKKDKVELKILSKKIRKISKKEMRIIENFIDKNKYNFAILNIHKLMFLKKFNIEINNAFILIES
ncbi:Fe-S protein assembly co-chaperone HscB [Candidatus Profftella armatura (Diaphorina cf. continua)]|uniref:Co-chaperone protein HscB homolog n=1 Tax=Candidatus Profftella armatura (Diaphorina cf. continua) TaxID=2661583 RepID=A0A7R7AC56_9PROT|nr:Fe-S protein assembly co-chaperone HscB [Candidatus Profftella armatura (Diaphorina cf. continua)]BCG49425.1 Fe-S protein assembly co-chaperone HscB [Candidatus Profftella armatura (Diaphorina cf. continua)]